MGKNHARRDGKKQQREARVRLRLRMRVSKRASTRARGRERTFFFAIAAAVLDVGPIVPFAARAGSPRASRVPIDDGPTFLARSAWPRAPGMGGSEKRTPSPGKAFVTPRSVRCQCLRAPLAPSPLGLCVVVLVGAVASAGTRARSGKNAGGELCTFSDPKYLNISGITSFQNPRSISNCMISSLKNR